MLPATASRCTVTETQRLVLCSTKSPDSLESSRVWWQMEKCWQNAIHSFFTPSQHDTETNVCQIKVCFMKGITFFFLDTTELWSTLCSKVIYDLHWVFSAMHWVWSVQFGICITSWLKLKNWCSCFWAKETLCHSRVCRCVLFIGPRSGCREELQELTKGEPLFGCKQW